jgi:hypothetical protein
MSDMSRRSVRHHDYLRYPPRFIRWIPIFPLYVGEFTVDMEVIPDSRLKICSVFGDKKR